MLLPHFDLFFTLIASTKIEPNVYANELQVVLIFYCHSW